MKKSPLIEFPKRGMEMMAERIIDIETANAFAMLSVYLTTTATSNPPRELRQTRNQTNPVYPWKKPCSLITLPSFEKAPNVPIAIPPTPSWICLIHKLVFAPLSIFSK
eukprot:CAMPEP_0114141572 /NCGR_PEP_ID=MMETSP0043_2-20121206/17980_1 /TAXON_ID=464988 /ORGANISM="Hemiselmis andersenii, Strain CCMP644" /LENGTH=107 /DNA_ID=CAMNT_0001235723 /DNA_START=258 /DNA_END=581 /DNA_ORIENTATION=-